MRKKPDTAILGFLVASSLDGEQSSAKNPLEGAMVASYVWDSLLLAQRYRPQDFRVPSQVGFPKEGSCEGFVKIGKAPVRLTRIIPGREGFLEAARLYLAYIRKSAAHQNRDKGGIHSATWPTVSGNTPTRCVVARATALLVRAPPAVLSLARAGEISLRACRR